MQRHRGGRGWIEGSGGACIGGHAQGLMETQRFIRIYRQCSYGRYCGREEPMGDDIKLRVSKIEKSFPGVKALDKLGEICL